MRATGTRIGELDQRVELQKEVFTSNDMGGATASWQTQATVWAQVRALTGRERFTNERLAGEGGYRVVIRNRTDIDPQANWAILWRGLRLNILFPQDNGPRPLYLVFDCEAGVPA